MEKEKDVKVLNRERADFNNKRRVCQKWIGSNCLRENDIRSVGEGKNLKART